MPRLNVEDSILADERFRALCRKLGDEDKALGLLLRFWRVAQKHWGHGELVPQKTFALGGFELLVEVDLAELRHEGVYARGSEEQFAWYRQRVEAGKGRSEGAERDRGKFTPSKPADDQRTTSGRPAKPRKTPIPDQPLTPTLSLTLTPTHRTVDAAAPSSPSKSLTPGSLVWNAYADAYQKAYQQPPVRNSKTNSLCKQLVERLGEEGASLVVRFYLTHRNAYYVQRCHPLSACVHDAEGLHTQAKANHRVSAADAREADKSQANEQTFAAVTEKLRSEGLL